MRTTTLGGVKRFHPQRLAPRSITNVASGGVRTFHNYAEPMYSMEGESGDDNLKFGAGRTVSDRLGGEKGIIIDS